MPASPLLLFITLNGTNHPLAACRWLRVGPDGCDLRRVATDEVKGCLRRRQFRKRRKHAISVTGKKENIPGFLSERGGGNVRDVV